MQMLFSYYRNAALSICIFTNSSFSENQIQIHKNLTFQTEKFEFVEYEYIYLLMAWHIDIVFRNAFQNESIAENTSTYICKSLNSQN